MKMKHLNLGGDIYESPAVMEVCLASESILCVSADIEEMGFVEDNYGWDK